LEVEHYECVRAYYPKTSPAIFQRKQAWQEKVKVFL